MAFQLVVFDIAGTTVTDQQNVHDAFRGAFEKLAHPVTTPAVNHIMGYRKMEAIKMLLQQFYPAQLNNDLLIAAIHEQFELDMQQFYRHTADLQPLPFAVATFRLLKANNIKIGLDTGFTKSITDIIINRLGWLKDGLIDVVVSSDEVKEGRPQPYMIWSMMEQLNLRDLKKVAKVGDTEVDILEGRNAGCGLVVSVTTGSYSKEELEEFTPDHIIASLQELPVLLGIDQPLAV